MTIVCLLLLSIYQVFKYSLIKDMQMQKWHNPCAYIILMSNCEGRKREVFSSNTLSKCHMEINALTMVCSRFSVILSLVYSSSHYWSCDNLFLNSKPSHRPVTALNTNSSKLPQVIAYPWFRYLKCQFLRQVFLYLNEN